MGDKMFFWTETPIKEIWNQIRYLKSPKNVENLLSGRIQSRRVQIHCDPTELPKRSFEIASCIRQADDYYGAAETVGLVTQPLLQFYGALSLVKAVILSNTTKRLSDFEYHGLNGNPRTAKEELRNNLITYKNHPSHWKIENEFAITHNGVFPNLCESIEENIPENGVVITFKELLKRIPDLSGVYTRHYGENSYCTRISGNKVPQNSFLEKCTLQGAYGVLPLDCGIYKTFPIIFIGLFILSNLVRYKPAFWMNEIEGKNSGSVAMVESFSNLAKRRLPE